MKRFFCLLIVLLLLPSCSIIKYGTSSTVTLYNEDKHEQKPVHITAIGQKGSYELDDVHFPYVLKVKHKDIPMRLFAFGDSLMYSPASIKGEEVGVIESFIYKWEGWGISSLLTATGLLVILLDGGVEEALMTSAMGIGVGVPFILLGNVTRFNISDTDHLSFKSEPSNTLPSIMNSPQWRVLQIKQDIYNLISEEQYTTAIAEANYLLNQISETNAELLFLKGASLYHLGELKKSIKELDAAWSNSRNLPQEFRHQIWEYLYAAENGQAAKAEERRQNLLAALQVASQVTVAALQFQQQSNNPFYIPPVSFAANPFQEQTFNPVLPSNPLNNINFSNLTIPSIDDDVWKETVTYDQFGNKMISYPGMANQIGKWNDEFQQQMASVSSNLMASGDSYSMALASAYQGMANTNNWMIQLDQQIWNTPMYPEVWNEVMKEMSQDNSQKGEDSADSSDDDSSVSKEKPKKTYEPFFKEKVYKIQNSSKTVTSKDVTFVKKVQIYLFDGRKAFALKNDLVKIGAEHYVLIGDMYYLAMHSNWEKYDKTILYEGARTYYYFNM